MAAEPTASAKPREAAWGGAARGHALARSGGLVRRLGMAQEEVFLPFPAPRASIAPASSFRSTWLSASVRSLRERGLLDRYLAHLPAELHDPILATVVGVWLPTSVAVAHYEACDALGLTQNEQVEIGREVSRNVHGTILGTVVRLATQAGVSPWSAFGTFGRLWDRIWVGGAVGVFKLGPKDARIEIIGWPCARVPYCRVAMRGVMLGLTELFCQKAYVHEVPKLCTPTTLGYRIQWA